jgi:hypothetical protein
MRQPNGDRTTSVWDYENQSTPILKPDVSRVTMVYNAIFRRVEGEAWKRGLTRV